MAGQLKILGIHGLGDHRNVPWAQNWEQAIRQSVPSSDQIGLSFVPFSYDEIFERVTISPAESLRAFWKLAGSGVGSLFRRRARGLVDSAQQFLRWHAGYVVAWVEDEGFRTEVRKRLLKAIADEKPDVILAHSLGSLISYDALSSPDAARRKSVSNHLKKVTCVTLGSQLGNPFVMGNLTPGRIEPLSVRQWFHLYNPEDAVFTAEVRLPGVAGFRQITTFFDIDGWADHAAVEYLQHTATRTHVWFPLAEQALAPRSAVAEAARALQVTPSAKELRAPRKRALLVGINDYPDPSDRLEGCVNDVFRMSEVLQECGIPAEQIRVVLDKRATAEGIMDRLNWLLDDPGPDDELVFYYSGHGAQLPTYGEGDQVDRMDETLVPWNFNWSPETCITDDQIYILYSQLPYDTRLVMIFDCCHSGGIHRDSGQKIRGLNPPDDIRHRALRWNAEMGMWVARDFEALNRRFTDDEEDMADYAGETESVLRLGRAMMLRRTSEKEYVALKRRSKGRPVGPYLPVIIQACREHEFAYEYRHGVTSFGAFTYSLTDILRRTGKLTFQKLVAQTGERLATLGYEQQPAILGPNKILKARVPWSG